MPKSISIVTFLALAILAVSLVTTIIYGAASYHAFLSLEGLLIVIGGSVINAFMSYQQEDVWKAFATIRNMLKKSPATRTGLHHDIMQFIRWSYVMQAEDLLGLDKEIAGKIRDPILRYGMDLVITGYPADKIREMVRTAAEAEFERRCVPVTVLRNMAATTPAFGMIGTLVGMVTILNNVGSDISNIGGGLAIAVCSTLATGLLAARLVCLPAADKLLQREENKHFRNDMMAEGFALLAEKQKPYYVQDKLNSFLEPSQQIDVDDYVHRSSRRQFSVAA